MNNLAFSLTSTVMLRNIALPYKSQHGHHSREED